MTTALDIITARLRAESLMTSTCTIREPLGVPTTDPVTGEVTETPGATVYSGKCRIRQPGNWGVDAMAGGERISPASFQISVPAAVSTVESGHLLTVNSSPDAQAVGRVFRVRFTPPMGDISARRLICEEV